MEKSNSPSALEAALSHLLTLVVQLSFSDWGLIILFTLAYLSLKIDGGRNIRKYKRWDRIRRKNRLRLQTKKRR